MTNIQTLLKKLENPKLPAIDLGLARVYPLLEMLGNPHHRLPPVIHVAGTNGKGSLIATLQAVLEAEGYAVHRYISPHLVRFHERIILVGREIKDAALYPLLKKVASRLDEFPVTFFESTTAAAFLAFAGKKADVLLLETGMGGRLDATNVVEKPLLSIITPIAIDHAEFLGNTLAKIAAEKAGIIKPGVSCVVGPQPKEAMQVIEKKARALHAPLYRYGKEWKVEKHREGFVFIWGKQKEIYPLPNLPGEHQIYNAATAMACLNVIHKSLPVSKTSITQGITHTHWPARLQRLKKGGLVKILPKGWELWLDGGHNPSAGTAIAGWAKTNGDKPLFLVCGMMGTKDARAFLQPIAPYAEALCAISIPGEKGSYAAKILQAIAAEAGIEDSAAASPEAALRKIVGIGKAYKQARVLICGSLYLAGHILTENN